MLYHMERFPGTFHGPGEMMPYHAFLSAQGNLVLRNASMLAAQQLQAFKLHVIARVDQFIELHHRFVHCLCISNPTGNILAAAQTCRQIKKLAKIPIIDIPEMLYQILALCQNPHIEHFLGMDKLITFTHPALRHLYISLFSIEKGYLLNGLSFIVIVDIAVVKLRAEFDDFIPVLCLIHIKIGGHQHLLDLNIVGHFMVGFLPERKHLADPPVAPQLPAPVFVFLIELLLIKLLRLQQLIHRNAEKPGNLRQQRNIRIRAARLPPAHCLKGHIQIPGQFFLGDILLFP